jgi:hypothetical protein
MRSWFKEGLNPADLYGVATRNMSEPRRKRGEAARKRRRAKTAAKRMGVTLKSYLRRQPDGA